MVSAPVDPIRPQRLQTRTLRPSPSTLIPLREALSQRLHTTSTLEKGQRASRSMMPPCRSFCVGRWCFFHHVELLDQHPPGGRSTAAPSRACALPTGMTATVSPRRTCT